MGKSTLENFSDIEKDFLYKVYCLGKPNIYTYKEGNEFVLSGSSRRAQADFDLISHKVMVGAIREHDIWIAKVVTELVVATVESIIEYIKLYGLPVGIRLETNIIKNRLSNLVTEGLVKEFSLKASDGTILNTYYVITLPGVDTVRRHCRAPRQTFDKNILSECASSILLRLAGNKISLLTLNALKDNGCEFSAENCNFLSTVYRKEEERKERLFCEVECTKGDKRYGIIVEPVSFSVESWKSKDSLENDIKSRLGFIHQEVSTLLEREKDKCDDVVVVFSVDSKACCDGLLKLIYERCSFLLEHCVFTSHTILKNVDKFNEGLIAYGISGGSTELLDADKFSDMFGVNSNKGKYLTEDIARQLGIA